MLFVELAVSAWCAVSYFRAANSMSSLGFVLLWCALRGRVVESCNCGKLLSFKVETDGDITNDVAVSLHCTS